MVFRSELSEFIWYNELPVASTSQYAQWSVFRLAKDVGITVLLDGQGGDELLGGYEQYFEKYLQSLNYLTIDEQKRIEERYPLALLNRRQKIINGLPQQIRHFLY